jgi:muramidase (phage lysozyme)
VARSLQDYQAAASNPYGRALLDVIASAEGADYNVMFGGGRFDTSKGWRHPDKKVTGGGYTSTAAGAYQFLTPTWNEVAGQLGIKDFSPANQDAAAMRLIERRGVSLDDVMAGKVDATTLAKLAPEWASLPTAEGKSYYGQPVKKAADLLAKFTAAVKGAPPAAGAGFQGAAAGGGAPAGGLSMDAADPYRGVGSAPMPMPGQGQSAQELALATIGAAVAAGGAGMAGNAGLQYLAARGAQGRAVQQRMAGALAQMASGEAPAAALPQPAAAPAGAPAEAQPAQAGAPAQAQAGGGGGPVPFKRSVSTSFDQGQPGLDLYFEDKQFRALLPGRIKDIGYQGSGRGASGKGYGNYVVTESIDPATGEKVDVLYGHLDSVNVTKGQEVGEGFSIGKQGGTGRVLSQDGTIASVDFLQPAPAGSGSMTPYKSFDALRRRLAKRWSV